MTDRRRDSEPEAEDQRAERTTSRSTTASTRKTARKPAAKPSISKRSTAKRSTTRSTSSKTGAATKASGARSSRKIATPKPVRKTPTPKAVSAVSASSKPSASKEVPASAKEPKPGKDFESAWAKAEAAAQARRDKQPDAETTDLYKQLLRDKCLRAGTLGAATSVAAMVPGLGTIASFAIDGIGDMAYTAELQHDLALTTFALYGRKPNEKERLRIAGWIATFGAGGSELIEQVGKMVARQLAKNLAGRLLRRGLPFAEVAYSTGTHLAGTYFVGRRAQLYCIGLSDAESEILLESEKGIKLQVRRMKKLAQESVEAMEERFGMPGRTLAILFRKLTGREKA